MRKRIFLVLTLLLFISDLFLPQAVYAKIRFKNIFRGIKRGVHFVVTVPDRATRWMGPVLGPIAADLLTQNILKNPRIGRIFRRAEQIDRTIKNVEDQKKYLDGDKKNFRDEADNLDKQAQAIREKREQLSESLISGEITYNEYKDKVISLDRIADAYSSVAERFRNSADKINPNDLTRILTRNVWQGLLRQIRDGIKYELNNEINRYLDPNIIKTLVEGGNLSFDDLLNSFIARDVEGSLSGGDGFNKDELLGRVKDRINQILKDNKEALKNNWMAEIDKIIKEEKEKLEKEKKDLPAETVPTDEPKDDDSKTTTEQSGKCPNGYEYCPSCGIECRQIDCNSIPSGHWDYVSRCICGSAGSINENPNDPNKGCYYGADYTSCPGCLYACVHYNEDCPKK